MPPIQSTTPNSPTHTVLEILDDEVSNGYCVLSRNETLIGRYEFCDVVLDDQSVSRQHARIFRLESGYFLEDLGSVNGTFLNSKQIHEPVPLKDRDRIRFYKVTAIFHEGTEGPPFMDASESAILGNSLPRHSKVKHWVRNLERRPEASFWLQTSTDRFYPDFLALLEDGRILVVESKGEYLWSNDDSKEKRAVGDLWEARSGGKCLFVMPKGPDWNATQAAVG